MFSVSERSDPKTKPANGVSDSMSTVADVPDVPVEVGAVVSTAMAALGTLVERLVVALAQGHRGSPAEPWMTTSEAAAHAGVTEETIRDWVKRGWIRGIGRSGRELRLRASAVDAFLTSEPGERTETDVDPRVLELLGGRRSS